MDLLDACRHADLERVKRILEEQGDGAIIAATGGYAR